MAQNEQAALPAFVGVPPLLITVHGIRTFGQWQERLEQLVLSGATNVRAVHYKYGYFSIFAFIVPFLRWLVTRRFRRALIRMLRRNPGVPIQIVAHSFGTHIVGWALWDLRNEPLCRVQTVVLAGSVLKSNFPWNTLLDRGIVKCLLNECGTRDNVLLLNQVAVLFTGMAGRIGFNGFLDHRFANHFHAFGHSDYFVSDGSPSNSFMARRWVPLLINGRMPPSVDERSSSAAAGVITFVAQNAEPIKVFAYSSPLIALSLVLFFLYANAEEQRRLASARAKAAEAQLLLTTDELQLEPAAQLAIDASIDLRDTRLAALRRRFSHVLGDRFAEPSSLSSNVIYTLRSAVALLPLNRHSEHFRNEDILDAVSPSVAFALRNRQSTVRLYIVDLSQKYDPSPDGEDPRKKSYTLDLNTARVTSTTSSTPEATSEDSEHTVSVDGVYTATLRGDRVEVARRGGHELKSALVQLERPADPMFSPNNRYLAWRTEQKTGEPLAGSFCLWEFRTRAQAKCLPQEDAVNALAFSPDESTIAVALGASPDGSGGYKESVADAAVLLSTESFEILQTLRHRARVTNVSFSPTGNRIASLSEDHTVKVWSTESGRELRRVVVNGELVSADFLPDGRLLTLSEHEVRLDDVAGEPLGELGDPRSVLLQFAFNHGGKQLAVAYEDHLQIWNVHPVRLEANLPIPKYTQYREQQKPKVPVNSSSLNKGEEELLDQFRTDVDKLNERQHEEEIVDSTRLSFSSDDTCVVVERSTLAGPGQQFAWSIPRFTPIPQCNGARIATLETVAGSFHVEATEPAYKEKRSINLMATKSGDVVSDYALASYVDGDDKLKGGGFGLSPNGESFATIVDDHLKVVVRNLINGREHSFLSPRQFVSISFSPDSRYLALGEVEGTVSIVDLRSMREVDRFIDPEGVSALQFASSGHTLAVAHKKLLTLYELDLQTLADEVCTGRLRCSSR